jgi:uncharacterized MAPEG superfamily protein
LINPASIIPDAAGGFAARATWARGNDAAIADRNRDALIQIPFARSVVWFVSIFALVAMLVRLFQ